MVTIESLAQLDGEPHANAFPTDEPKTVRLTLAEGQQVDPHRHPDRDIVLYLISGELDLRLGDGSRRVAEGDVARFDGDQEISPTAITDSTALLVLAQKAGE